MTQSLHIPVIHHTQLKLMCLQENIRQDFFYKRLLVIYCDGVSKHCKEWILPVGLLALSDWWSCEILSWMGGYKTWLWPSSIRALLSFKLCPEGHWGNTFLHVSSFHLSFSCEPSYTVSQCSLEKEHFIVLILETWGKMLGLFSFSFCHYRLPSMYICEMKALQL